MQGRIPEGAVSTLTRVLVWHVSASKTQAVAATKISFPEVPWFKVGNLQPNLKNRR